MCRVPHNRALGMPEQLTRGGQVQVEFQRRRRPPVQGTQNGQTPLDAQEDAERQVLALRKGRWYYNSYRKIIVSRNRCARKLKMLVAISLNFLKVTFLLH